MRKQIGWIGVLFAGLVFGAGPALAQDNQFAAIAFSTDTNAVGYSYDAPTQAAAEERALARCAEHADDCEITNWAQNTCSALSIDVAGLGGWGADWGHTFREAANNAQKQCLAYNDNCQPLVWVCNSVASPN